MSSMNQVAIGDQASWCRACGNSTGICAPSTVSSSTSSSEEVSKSVAGVTGGIVLVGLEALFMLLGGYRLRRKGTVSQNGAGYEEDDGSSSY